MNNKQKHFPRLWIVFGILLGILLVFSLCSPGSTPPETEPQTEILPIVLSTPTPLPTNVPTPSVSPVLTVSEDATATLEQTTAPTPAESEEPLPTEHPTAVCSIRVTCQNALAPDSGLNPSTRELLPSDGMILCVQNVSYRDGETAFDILTRELKHRNIHFEFNENPMFNSAYIEGIYNLYEFDCGSRSGWLYLVNGKSPGVGSSQYILQPGDSVEFIYSCNFGKDIF